MKKTTYKRHDLTLFGLVSYLERIDTKHLGIIKDLADFKSAKQLKLMIEGAKCEKHLGALRLLSAALVVRSLQDIERSRYS